MAYKDYRPVDYVITASEAAYTANDVVGGLLTIPIPNGGTGRLVGYSIAVGEISIAVPGALWIYSTVPTTTIADNAAFAPVHADNAKNLAVLTLPAAITVASFNIYQALLTTPLPFGTNGNLYIYFVTSGTPNFTGAAQVINVKLLVECEV
jgi:hypothetical protein